MSARTIAIVMVLVGSAALAASLWMSDTLDLVAKLGTTGLALVLAGGFALGVMDEAKNNRGPR